MYEIIAVIADAAASGLVGWARRPLWLAGLLGALAGMTVTVISGEIGLSVGYLVFDAGQAAVAGLLTALLGARIRHGRLALGRFDTGAKGRGR